MAWRLGMADTSGQGKVAVFGAQTGVQNTCFRKKGRWAMRDLFKPLLNIFNSGAKPRKPKRRLTNLALEGLETRLAPAIDMLITSAGDPSSYSLIINNGVATFTAVTSGAKISVATIQSQLAAGNDVVINNSTQVLPFPEDGKITWDTSLDMTGIPQSGSGRTITIVQNPGTIPAGGTGPAPIILGTALNDFLIGDQVNNVDVVINPAGAAPSSGPKVQFYGSDSAIKNLTINANNVGYVEFVEDFTTIQNMTINAQSVVASGKLTAGATTGDFVFNSTSNGGVITFTANSAITAAGNITVNGSLGTNAAGSTLTLHGDTIAIAARLGVKTTPFGVVTLSALNNVTVGDTGGLEKIVSDPTRMAYNLFLNGGMYFTNPVSTQFDSLGTINLGNGGTLDAFTFVGGLDLTNTENRVTVSNSSLTTHSQPILLGNAKLNTEVHLITGPTASPAGANIDLTTSPTIAAGTKLLFNSGTGGVTTITNALTGIGSITIDNSLKTVFQNPVTLTAPLNINQTQTDVIFSKASTIGAVNMLPGQGFRLNLAAPVTVNGPITGTEQVVMTGAGTPLPISTINGTSNNYFGSFVSSSGILAVNGTYVNGTALLNGGYMTGTGTVKAINSGAGLAIRYLAPGGFTPTTTNTGGVITTVNVPTVGTFTGSTLTLGTNTNLVIDIASAASNDLLVSSSTVVAPNLGGAVLSGNLLNGYVPNQGTKFTILQNNSTLPVTGIFAGIPEGGFVTIGGVSFRVSYVGIGGADGIANDVVLTTMTGIVPPGPTPTPGNGDYVFYLYNSILGRNPDVGGFNNFVAALNGGVPRNVVANALYVSAEHRSNQVQGYFQTYLKRTASAAEVNGWVGYYLSGATDFQVMTGFLTSNEYMSMNPPISGYISGLYVSILGRTADAEGLASWTRSMMASMPKQQVVMAMLTSAEATQRQAALDYNYYLGRVGDINGIHYWGSVIASMGPGAAVVGLTSSEEAFNRAQLLYS